MGVSYLEARLTALRSAQNADGGWGYFPGKQSWLEPTVYSALALHGEPAADRAWGLLSSWQSLDGRWRPAQDVQLATWGAALCVTLAAVRGDFGDRFRRGVEWLLDSEGVESSLVNRTAARVGLLNAGRNLSFKGWPWKPGTSSWVEPTAHSLVALKKAYPRYSDRDLAHRVKLGEAQLLDVRCRDGGWNYGSASVLGVDLPSYPETTALALFGLQGHAGLGGSLDLAGRMAGETASTLARAWLTISLRLHGAKAPKAVEEEPGPDVMVNALEALGGAGGNYSLLRATEAT